MISSCAQSSLEEESVILFIDLLHVGIKPVHFTLASVLRACSLLTNDLSISRQIHVHALKTGNTADSFVTTALIDVTPRVEK